MKDEVRHLLHPSSLEQVSPRAEVFGRRNELRYSLLKSIAAVNFLWSLTEQCDVENISSSISIGITQASKLQVGKGGLPPLNLPYSQR